MYEVLEVMPSIVLLLGLFYFAWMDHKTKLMSGGMLLLLGVAGVLLQWNEKMLWQTAAGMLVGVILSLIALISKESIGIGDGMLFIVTGSFLDFTQNVALLLGTLFLTGVFAIACLVLKKKGRNDRVALGPFVLAAYVMFIL